MSELSGYDVYFGSEDEEGDSYRVGIKLKWNYTNEKIIKRKGLTKDLNLYMAKTFASYCQRYVPYKTWALRNSMRVYARKNENMGRVVWNTKYAEAQYSMYPHKRHPLTTCFWDQTAWNIHGKTIVRKVDEERKRISREQSK